MLHSFFLGYCPCSQRTIWGYKSCTNENTSLIARNIQELYQDLIRKIEITLGTLNRRYLIQELLTMAF
jgi:hypothetical protein